MELATQIKAAQEPEITKLTGWLAKWGAEDDGMAGMGHGAGGMMSDEDMKSLTDASGAEATRLFLEGMTAHHEGAVEMAEEELDDGKRAGDGHGHCVEPDRGDRRDEGPPGRPVAGLIGHSGGPDSVGELW